MSTQQVRLRRRKYVPMLKGHIQFELWVIFNT